MVVTAWNPDSVHLPPGENEVRAGRLEAELVRLGAVHWPATGRDLATPHHEAGVAVTGLTEAEGIALGARFGQAAVYSWTEQALSVVSCTDDRRHIAGWRLIRRSRRRADSAPHDAAATGGMVPSDDPQTRTIRG